MLTSLLLSNIIGAPLAGVLLDSSFFGMHGWQELFILEAIPALAFAVFFFCVKDRPTRLVGSRMLRKQYLTDNFNKEQAAMQSRKKYTVLRAFHDPESPSSASIYFLSGVVGFWGFYFWMPTVLKELSGLSTSLLGGAIAIPMTALLVQLVISKTATKTGDKVWHVACTLSSAPSASASPRSHRAACRPRARLSLSVSTPPWASGGRS